MNYRAIFIVCLATLGLAVAGWGQGWNKIAFVSNRDGLSNIWIMNADGSDPVNLTKGQGCDCVNPAWSPDGMTIAYIASGEIWLMDADGGNPQQVTDDAVHKVGFAWSEDGVTRRHENSLCLWSQPHLIAPQAQNPRRLAQQMHV